MEVFLLIPIVITVSPTAPQSQPGCFHKVRGWVQVCFLLFLLPAVFQCLDQLWAFKKDVWGINRLNASGRTQALTRPPMDISPADCQRVRNSTVKCHSWKLRNSLLGNQGSSNSIKLQILGASQFTKSFLSFIPCEL